MIGVFMFDLVYCFRGISQLYKLLDFNEKTSHF